MIARECVGDGELNLFQIRRLRRLLSSERTILKQFGQVLERKRAKWGLHPLIHTLAPRNLTQDIGKKKAEKKTPHFLSLNQRYCRLVSRAKV